MEAEGMTMSGVSPDGTLVEIIEVKDHPWFVGVQFHPEFQSRPLKPHPLFQSFIGASKKYRDQLCTTTKVADATGTAEGQTSESSEAELSSLKRAASGTR